MSRPTYWGVPVYPFWFAMLNKERRDMILALCARTHAAGGPCGDPPSDADLAAALAALQRAETQQAEIERLAMIGRKAVEWLNPTPGKPNNARAELEELVREFKEQT